MSAKLLAACKALLLLCDSANPGAFANGVTSPEGHDEGVWKASQLMDEAYEAIQEWDRGDGAQMERPRGAKP